MAVEGPWFYRWSFHFNETSQVGEAWGHWRFLIGFQWGLKERKAMGKGLANFKHRGRVRDDG